MGDGMYISSPDAYDGETCRLTIRNRLEDFYHNETLCEYENCKGTAVHHCADGTLYWEGCGRVFCEEHACSLKDSNEGNPLAFVCTECH